VQPSGLEVRGTPDTAAAAIINSGEGWPQRMVTVTLANLFALAATLWVFR
jgi:hypothetical protein